MENFKIDIDSDGIALVTFDVPGVSNAYGRRQCEH
jgi:hypothetical protein